MISPKQEMKEQSQEVMNQPIMCGRRKGVGTNSWSIMGNENKGEGRREIGSSTPLPDSVDLVPSGSCQYSNNQPADNH